MTPTTARSSASAPSQGTSARHELAQGNIIRAFARPHCAYLFFRLDEGSADSLRSQLGSLLKSMVTSDDEQHQISQKWNQTKEDKGVASFGLSGSGMARLGLSSIPEAECPEARAVLEGGVKKGPEYVIPWDPATAGWQPEYRDQSIDGFLLLAHNELPKLKRRVSSTKKKLSGFGALITDEWGFRLAVKGQEIEHFGFRDGVSAGPPPESVLWPSGACYAAFLKLEQNVKSFRDQCQHVAQSIGATRDDVASLAVGRHPDGTPLVKYGTGIDDFTFTGPDNQNCPYHAHIRVMNPRDGSDQPAILRRGHSYGAGWDGATGPPPETGSGLLFLSYQKSLLDVLAKLSRSNYFKDPILSHTANWPVNASAPNQTWTVNGQTASAAISDVVTVRGGEFFYVPGMKFIRELT